MQEIRAIIHTPQISDANIARVQQIINTQGIPDETIPLDIMHGIIQIAAEFPEREEKLAEIYFILGSNLVGFDSYNTMYDYLIGMFINKTYKLAYRATFLDFEEFSASGIRKLIHTAIYLHVPLYIIQRMIDIIIGLIPENTPPRQRQTRIRQANNKYLWVAMRGRNVEATQYFIGLGARLSHSADSLKQSHTHIQGDFPLQISESLEMMSPRQVFHRFLTESGINAHGIQCLFAVFPNVRSYEPYRNLMRNRMYEIMNIQSAIRTRFPRQMGQYEIEGYLPELGNE